LNVHKKTIWSLVAIAILVAACSPVASPQANDTANTPSATTNAETGTNILQFAVSGFQSDTYSNLIDAFEAENPDVHISIVSIEDVLGTRPGSSLTADSYLQLAAAADVIAEPATRQAVQAGALLDLSHFFEADSTLTRDAFYPGLLESVEWGGKIWSVPSEATYPLIYFDKTLFDAAGLDYPQPGWTWDDFLADAKALTIGSGDTVSQWGFVEPSFDPVTFVQSRAGLLFDPDTSPPTARLDDPAVIDAVRWYTDLFLTYDVSPYYSTSGQGGPGGMFNNETMRLIGSGQAAMWFVASGGGFRVAFDRGGPGGQQQQTIGVVPFPVSQASDHTTPAVVTGFSVSAGTQKADLAWKWISFLVQQQAQSGPRGQFNVLSSGTVPALPSVAAAAGYWDALDDDTAAALHFAIDHATVDNYNGTGYDTFTSAVVSVMDDGADIETALADAQSTVTADIETEVAAEPTPVSDLVVTEKEQQAVNAGAVIITFGLGEGGIFGQQSMSTLVDQFEAEHPDILVELKTPEGFRGQLDLAGMAAQYDCFEASPSLNDTSVASIVNIEPFLAADSNTSKEDFFPSLLEQFTYQGQLWGLPGSATVGVVTYNKDLFDAAHLPYPSSTWTTSDFLEAAVALTKGNGDAAQYGYVPTSSAVNDLVSIMDRLGANMLDESVDPPRLNFTSPDVVEAFRWYTGLTTQYKVTPDLTGQTGDFGSNAEQRQTLITSGRAGMWMNSGGGFGFGGNRVFIGGGGGGGGFGGPGGSSSLNTGIAPLPAGPNSAKGSGFQSVNGYFISAQTEQREACWEWIAFLTEQPNVTSGLPGRQSVAESAAYRQLVGTEQADAYLASVSSSTNASFFQRISDEGTWLGFASLWLSDAYDQVINGDATVEDALAAAQQSVDDYRDCVIAQNAFDDPQALRQCISESGGPSGGVMIQRGP
jgi:multiple sugar transport system substrate-binding protein